MYVCICNALTEHDIAAAASNISATRPSELFAACRCRAQCGTCVRRILAMIQPPEFVATTSGAEATQAA